MFRCGLCRFVSKPGKKATRVVVETREVKYPVRLDAHSLIFEGRRITKDDPGGVGIETVKEILVCKRCLPEQSNAPQN